MKKIIATVYKVEIEIVSERVNLEPKVIEHLIKGRIECAPSVLNTKLIVEEIKAKRK